jgi:hypothetical protein
MMGKTWRCERLEPTAMSIAIRRANYVSGPLSHGSSDCAADHIAHEPVAFLGVALTREGLSPSW